jgi:hypothetical protein
MARQDHGAKYSTARKMLKDTWLDLSADERAGPRESDN